SWRISPHRPCSRSRPHKPRAWLPRESRIRSGGRFESASFLLGVPQVAASRGRVPQSSLDYFVPRLGQPATTRRGTSMREHPDYREVRFLNFHRRGKGATSCEALLQARFIAAKDWRSIQRSAHASATISSSSPSALAG